MSAAEVRGGSAAVTPDGSVFVIEGFAIEGSEYRASFTAVIDGQEQPFVEGVSFADVTTADAPRPAEPLLRLLALASSVSYYKATRSATIRVAFPLSSAERRFLAEVVAHGLGEYAYRNDVEWKLTPAIEAEERADAEGAEAASLADAERILGRAPLVAVGGGKDSIVSIEALKARGPQPELYSVNGLGAIAECERVAGRPAVTLRRSIDRGLLAANAQGALNGHVPVSAINALIGMIAADLAGLGSVVFSNEESANYGNLEWRGRSINHQWSKSLQFEDLLRDTLRADGLAPDRFFSLLRGYRELDVARAFSRLPAYRPVFNSCNRAYVLDAQARERRWCGTCPKCQFVFLILAPYLGKDALVEVFSRDLLDDVSLADGFRDILGVGSSKPFECVGEPEEAVQALQAIAAQPEWAPSRLVAQLAPLFPSSGGDAFALVVVGEDRVPAAFAAARDWVAEDAR